MEVNLLVAAILLMVATTTYGAGSELVCKKDSVSEPSYSVIPTAWSPESDIIAYDCAEACRLDGFVYSALTEGSICFCGELIPHETSTCDWACQDGSDCGNLKDTAVLSIYDAGGGNTNFNITDQPIEIDVTQSISLTLDGHQATKEVFLVDHGHGGPQSFVNVSGTPTIIQDFNYLVPGHYTATVIGKLDGRPISTIVRQTGISVDNIPVIEEVNCPVVAEPDIPFACNISVVGKDENDTFTVTFDQPPGAAAITLSALGSPLYRLGNPPPFGVSPEVVPAAFSGNGTNLLEFPIMIESELIALEAYVVDNLTLEIGIRRPKCPNNLDYCLYSNTCESTCAYDTIFRKHSCSSVSSSYFNSEKRCCTEDSPAQCLRGSESEPPESWEEIFVQNAIGGPYFSYKFNVPEALIPGDILFARGIIGKSDDKYLLSAIVKEKIPVQILHTCRTINDNVTVQVNHASAPNKINVTACERNITDIELKFSQTITDIFDEDLNKDSPYFVRSNEITTYHLLFSVAGPMFVEFSYIPSRPSDLPNDIIPNNLTDYPLMDDGSLHELEYLKQVKDPGTYNVTIAVSNRHNIETGPLKSSVELVVEHPVMGSWIVESDMFQFILPSEDASITFTDTNDHDFPTHAKVEINWGDGIVEKEDFKEPAPVQKKHRYSTHGFYNVSAKIYNNVSAENVACNVTVIHEVEEFSVKMHYMFNDEMRDGYVKPKLDEMREGYGGGRDQFPINKNLNFVPNVTNGTIDYYTVKFQENGSHIFTFNVTDRYEPIEKYFGYHFDKEVFLDLTITANTITENNTYTEKAVNVSIRMVGNVKTVLIDGFSEVTAKDQEKTFMITFEKIGGGTCLVIDYGDDTPLIAYGERYTCKTNFSLVEYDETKPLELQMNITHVYKEENIFNISVFGYNPMSTSADRLMFLVTSLPCKPPKVSIVDGTLDFRAAPNFYRSSTSIINSKAYIDCQATSKTKKWWTIYNASDETGAQGSPVFIQDVLTSWNKSELSIQPRFLNYGLYKLSYVIKMWDPEILDPKWPFQKSVESYIQIIKSPLIAVMTEGLESEVIRGLGQSLVMEPAKYSKDPDFPDQKNFTVEWSCKVSGSNDSCFEKKEDKTKTNAISLTVKGSDFTGSGKSYEIFAFIRKDTRNATARIIATIVDDAVPVVKVRCVDSRLCMPYGTGVYINPTVRMAVTADCEESCGQAMTYEWDIKGYQDMKNESSARYLYNEIYFPVGRISKELSLSKLIFVNNPELEMIYLTMKATSEKNNTGGATYFMLINKSPTDGNCTIQPSSGTSVITDFMVECQGWRDPEPDDGILKYSVAIIEAEQEERLLTEMNHDKKESIQRIDLIIPPGDLNISVVITDIRGAIRTFIIPNVKISIPSEYEYLSANISERRETFIGNGDSSMLSMLIGASAEVIKRAPWMSLSAENTGNLSSAELDGKTVGLANENSNALSGIVDNTNFNSQGTIDAAGATVASIMAASSTSATTAKTIDLNSRKTVMNILDKMVKGVEEFGSPTPEEMRKTATNVATIASGIMGGLSSVADKETCLNTPPSDVLKADSLDYDTDIGDDIDLEIPDNLLESKKCNVRDITGDQGTDQVDKAEKAMDEVTKNILEKTVVGEKLEIESPNGMVMAMEILAGSPENKTENKLGSSGASFSLPGGLCPQGNCTDPVVINAREWPFITHGYSPGAAALSPGSKVVEIEIMSRNLNKLEVKDQDENPIEITIPRTLGRMGNSTLPEPELVNATALSEDLRIPIMYSMFNVTHNDSSVNLEITPMDVDHQLFVMISYLFLPTFKNHDWFTVVENITTQRNGTYDWFLSSAELTGTGPYYIGIGEFNSTFNASLFQEYNITNVTNVWLRKPITTDYTLRVYTSGCLFFNKTSKDWESQGLQVIYADFNIIKCSATHLTSFGSGLFVAPTTIDFSYVFANASFTDNLTIYIAMINTASFLILLLIWGRIKDKQDLTKLGASPLPDNRIKDKYMYEMMVFTGNESQAQTDSHVQFILSGENDETEVRTLGDDERKILRKAKCDVFVMTVPRTLGTLQFLRIWHDNSGSGPNASWYLSYIVLKDLQTGEKYEFICNKWLDVDSDDGQIDRLIPVAGKEQSTEFKHVFNTTTTKNISDGHLWLSVFLRPPRSRFTRCQRAISCFALLYLSMLVNMMWYERVPDQPSNGLTIGPFTLTLEQVGVGIMANLIVLPPSFLIVFFFRKARPRTLRKSRIEIALDRTKDAQYNNKSQLVPLITSKQISTSQDSGKGNYKRSYKKKFTLPWWFQIVAWLLALTCIGVSSFFLTLYGIQLGNSKTTKWCMSLIFSFFSSLLFVQPFKIFVTAMLLSLIFKPDDLEADDADEDEEEPNLKPDEEWIHDEAGLSDKSMDRKRFEYKKVDEKTLAQFREKRRKEKAMWNIVFEIFTYSMFLWIFMLISYGQRDPNSFLLVKGLRDNFLHEGAFDGTDFTQVTDTSKLWFYLKNGLLPDLRSDRLYNDKPSYGLKGFFGDHCNRIMGYAMIRQIRIKKRTCM